LADIADKRHLSEHHIAHTGGVDHAVDRGLPSPPILALVAKHRVGVALEALAHHHAASGLLRALLRDALRERGCTQHHAPERACRGSRTSHFICLRSDDPACDQASRRSQSSAALHASDRRSPSTEASEHCLQRSTWSDTWARTNATETIPLPATV